MHTKSFSSILLLTVVVGSLLGVLSACRWLLPDADQNPSPTPGNPGSTPTPFPREFYGVIDLNQAPWLSMFVQEYEAARTAQAEWVQNPTTIALRVAGYPNSDRASPDAVSTYYPQANEATVIVYSEGLLDDSIAAQEYRIDLVKTGKVWEITWVGLRQKCRRTPTQSWVTDLCP